MKRTIAATVVVIVLALAALRVYGAYKREQDAALARATKNEEQATQFESEEKRLQNQSDCNMLWMKYENALTEKRIAELEGRIGMTPIEPYCTGYAPRMDRALDDIQRTYNVTMAAITAREMAKLERTYAASPKLQTRYLRLRVWAFLTGTEVKQQQAQLVAEQEQLVAFKK